MNIGEILRAIDKHLVPPLIANNYNLAERIQACGDKFDAIEVETNEETLLVPKHHIYHLHAKVRINTDSQKLRADYLALTEAERGAQDSLKTQQKEL